MYLFVVALHIIVCLLLVLVIIIQPGKGGDVGSAFGGGAATAIFGPQGPTNLLQRATTVVASLFLVTSVTLAWYSSRATMANANVDDELLRLQEERSEKTENPEPAPSPLGDGEPDLSVEPAEPAPTP